MYRHRSVDGIKSGTCHFRQFCQSVNRLVAFNGAAHLGNVKHSGSFSFVFGSRLGQGCNEPCLIQYFNEDLRVFSVMLYGHRTIEGVK